MTYTVVQTKTASIREASVGSGPCVCVVITSAPRVATKRRGRKNFLTTAHQARHQPACPHSELVVTAFPLKKSASRRAKRIALAMKRRREKARAVRLDLGPTRSGA